MNKLALAFSLLVASGAAGTALALAASTDSSKLPDAAQLKKMAMRLAPVSLKTDVSRLSKGDRRALEKLIHASGVLNDIFIDQLWSGNRAVYAKLKKDRTALGRARLAYFWINKSPWSEIDGQTAFLPGVPATRPEAANFYPSDMTKDEFEKWVATLYPESQEDAKGFYCVIERDKNRHLTRVPYSDVYKKDLSKAARLLRDAAGLTDNASLKNFLELRARAFENNNYYDSEIAWMDIDAPVDVTIGPYETYNDGLYGYKAAFEAYVCVRDDAETKKLGFFSDHLQEIEDALPENPQYRVKKLGALAPIRVVNEVFGAGDGAHGIQTVAFNLPNDDRVVARKGAKRIMLKNVNEAKFATTLVPISRKVLSIADQKDVNFDAFFSWILSHELSHGIGPHEITVNGKATNPRFELKELYSAWEEAKADVTGLYLLQHLMDRNVLPGGPESEHKLYTTYLASAFRTLHFGLQDAHARGQAMQVNFLMDHGGVVAHEDGTFSIDFEKIKDAIRDLDHELLTIEATGDYAGASKMLQELAVLRPAIATALAGLNDVPTDINPTFTTANEILRGTPGRAGKAKGRKN